MCDLQLEEKVFKFLGDLAADDLQKICDELKLDVGEARKGNKALIQRSIFRFLTSEDVESAEDNGQQYFEKTLALIKSMSGGEDPFKKELFCSTTPMTMPKIKLDEDEERLQNIFMKPFKISGKIGKVGQNDSLTYSSLIFQLENGIKKGYSEVNIIDAMIKCISHESELRQYLEGRSDLNLVSLGKMLRYHYKEKDATTLFTSLSTAKQGNQESAQDFVLRLMNLRQKILFVSREESVCYDPKLVQKRFLHAVSTGLQNNNIRIALKDLVRDKETTDEDLLNKLTVVVADETDHVEKFSCTKKSSPQVNHIVEPPAKEPKKNLLLDELQGIKAQLNQIVLHGSNREPFERSKTLDDPIDTGGVSFVKIVPKVMLKNVNIVIFAVLVNI